MTMTMDASQQRFGSGLNMEGATLKMDYPPHPHHQPPTFSNPWTSSSPPQPTSNGAMFVGGPHQQPPAPLNPMTGKPHDGRAGSSSGAPSLPGYGSMPSTGMD